MIDKLVNFIRPTQSTIYDTESLTTLESIGKVIEKVNNCIENFNNLEVKTTNDYNNFINQITTYKNEVNKIINDIKNDNNSFKNEFREIIKSLENFNVKLEIINKQSKYIEDLAKINQDNIDKGTIATRNEINKINKTLVEKANGVDLQIEKNRIDNLINISSGEIDNVEMSDARISFKGKTYNTLGNAIREQFKEIADVGDKDLTSDLVWSDNKWIRQNYIETSKDYKVAKIEVKEGEVFTISGTIYNYQSLFVVRNEDDLDRSNNGGLGLLCYPEISNAVANIPYKLVENYQFTIPTGGKYLYVNKYCGKAENMGKESAFKLLKNNEEIRIKGLSHIEDNINAIKEQFKEIIEIVDKNITNGLVWSDNKWIRQNYIEDSDGYKVAKIEVEEGEVFTISGTIYNFQSLFVVRNENDLDRNNGGGLGLLCYPNISDAVANIPYKLVENYQFTIPTGGKYLYVNKYCGKSPNMGKESAFKLLKRNNKPQVKGIADVEKNIEKIKSENVGLDFDRENWKNRIIENQLKNDFAWGTPDKLYVTFCFDDSLADISDIEDLFEQKGVPCCFATVPNRLNNITNSGETVKQVLQRAVENGGEVLSHWATPLLPTSKNEDYYDVYVGAKKTLVENGFDVNGIITSGGGDFNLQDFDKDILLARPYYRYADLTDFNNTGVEQYLNRRRFLTTDNNNNKADIDTFISQGQLNNGGDKTYYGKYRWLPFASHGVHDNITIPILSELLDYIISKGTDTIQIVNYKYLFDNFSSSKLEKRILALENI